MLPRQSTAWRSSKRVASVGMTLFLLLLPSIFIHSSATAEEKIDFALDIRPILSDNCFQCHGPDEAERAADLRLDTKEGLSHAFASGDLDSSIAWERLTAEDPDMRMPPAEAPRQPSTAELEKIRRWIAAGANWSEHWAFSPITRPEVPAIPGVDHPIDRFVVSRLSQEGLKPAPQASRESIIRRLSFDIIGLPPTIEEVDQFIEDPSPDALDKLIDRLLRSPHYGERMALGWLDGARYADTNGYQNDFNRNMWPWRDWVINAYNQNMPFDQFIIEQLAGDLLPNPTLSQRVATGFNRNNRTVTEAGSIPAEWLVENVVDRVETTSTVFLGLTMGCARCHTHKFDPITHKEFYEFYSFFHNVNEKGVYQETRGNVPPLVSVPTPEQAAKQVKLQQRLAESEAELKELQAQCKADAKTWLEELKKAAVPVAPSSPILIPLDGQATALVNSVTQVSAKQEGSLTTNSDDLPTKSVQFDGEARLEFGDLVDPQADQPFTLSVWVKRNRDGAICSKMDGNNDYRGCDVLVQGDGKVAIHLISKWPSNAIKVVTERSLPENQWTALALSYDGSSKATGLSVYFQGHQQPINIETDKLSGQIDTEQPFQIGARDVSKSFEGSLAVMRIYGRVLTADELTSTVQADISQFAKHREQELTDPQRKRIVTLASDVLSGNPFDAMREARKQRDQNSTALQDLKQEVPTTMIMEELPEPRDTYVLKRGEYDKPIKDEKLGAGVPAFLPPLPKDAKPDRLALAQWLVARENPLTARVAVNRLWKRFFGTGLVETVENFGVQSEPPSHPELLDWLASELIDSGWDLQHIIRTIATSSTYQQSYYDSPRLDEMDPDNRLLARGPRHRLPAELIRDNALAISGLLSKKIGGPPVFPYQPDGLWDDLAGGANGGPYKQSTGEDLYRRSLYTFRKRTVSHPTTSTFDAPSFEYCTVDRATTNTPLQALAMLNDTTYTEAARCFASRMMSEGGDSPKERLTFGFRVATSRYPTADELAVLEQSLQQYRTQFEEDQQAAEKILSAGAAPQQKGQPASELASYATIAGILLNLDETITKE